MWHSLQGLALGDAFGQQFFREAAFIEPLLDLRQPPSGTWHWTDDTAMAIGIVDVLTRQGSLDQDELARVFARNYMNEPHRGYGAGQHRLMRAIADGADWREGARALFEGQGSLGNGAAMRAGPIGAYFAGDLGRVVEQATLASEVTHANAEGIAGGVGVAVAAALAADGTLSGGEFIARVAALTPRGRVRTGIESAAALDKTASVAFAATVLGNGSQIQAHDTVPFCVWAASRNLRSFEAAMWETVSALGDRDTTCAIVGGIVAAGGADLPAGWLAHREPLPPSAP
jgi:ADP-ribosylglycohydrolase